MKILISSLRLNSGGVEVSLIRMINELLKIDNIEITLLLEKNEGVYKNSIDSRVIVIELPFKYRNAKVINNNRQLIFSFFNKSFLLMGLKRFAMKLYISCFDRLNGNYDLAIDFHGYGIINTGYIIKKVNAKKKVTFIHDECMKWLKNVEQYLVYYDKIYCVSKACKSRFIELYPLLKNKADILYNIIDVETIKNLADESLCIKFNDNCFNIMTIGRLEHQKGYDLIIKIASILKQRAFSFNWYIIGTGSMLNEIENLIIKNNLSNNIILTGMLKNPYSLLKKCDIYVQPSRHEGYGLAIAEARILSKPIIATNLDCIKEQVINNYNGFLCNFDENDFSEKIITLINNNNLIDTMSKNSLSTVTDYNKEILKFFDLMEK